MFYDSLQAKLGQMESERPSPSLQHENPTLSDRLHFLNRWASRTVDQVPQKSSIYTSVDERVADYKLAFENEGYTGKGLEYLNQALSAARYGSVWKAIQGTLMLARAYSDVEVSSDTIRMIRDVYEECISTEGMNRADYYLARAIEIETGSRDLVGTI